MKSKEIKKIISLILSGAVTISFVGPKSINAFAGGEITNADDTTQSYTVLTTAATVAAEADFGFDAGTGTITSYSGTGGDVIVPSTIGGVEVNAIGGSAFGYNTSITSIIMPNTITTVGDFALVSCSSLVSVEMPGVTTIKARTFADCGALTTVIMPEVTEIGRETFDGCTSLMSAEMSKVITIGSNAFNNCEALTGVEIPEARFIGQGAFYNCKSITDITLRKVQTLSYEAFANCIGLVSLEIPNEGVLAEASVFSGCTSLKKVTVYYGINPIDNIDILEWQDSVGYKIGDMVNGVNDGWVSNDIDSRQLFNPGFTFDEETNTIVMYKGNEVVVTIPSEINGVKVTTIGSNAFKSNTTIESVVLPDSVTTIGSYAFYDCSNLANVVIPKVEIIEYNAFKLCTNLTSVEMPVVTSIGDNAFRKCTNLTSVEMPMATSIGNGVFGYCTSLEGLNIRNVSTIGDIAFENCTSLNNIEISNGVSTSGDSFTGCTGLTKVTIYYGDAPINEITVEQWDELVKSKMGDTILGQISERWVSNNSGYRNLAEPTVDTTAPVITLNGQKEITVSVGCSYTDTKATALDTIDGVVEVTSNNNVDTSKVGQYTVTFTATDKAGNAATETRTVNVTDKAIESDFTFDNTTGKIIGYTGLGGNIVIPATIGGVEVKSIGESAFLGITSITSVILPASVTKIEGDAFDGCTNLRTAEMPGVTEIQSWAFYSCTSLKSVVMPEVQKIDAVAFLGCSSLTTIELPKVITIGDGAFSSCISLTTAKMPELISLGAAFYGCTNLSNVEMPKVTTIAVYAFTDCVALDNIDIPKVTSLGIRAFYNCISLKSIIISSGVTKLTTVDGNEIQDDPIFEGCNLNSVTIDYGVNNIDSIVKDNWDAFVTSLELDPNSISGSFAKNNEYIKNLNDTEGPVIALNGDEYIEVELGRSYTELGATAMDILENKEMEVKISGEVNTAEVGEYTITYTSMDSSRNKSTKTRTVKVIKVDKIAPVITLKGQSSVTLTLGAPYVELGATVTDDSGEVITPTISGIVNTSKVGSYTVTYNATDSSGNSSSVTRTVNVIYKYIPILPSNNYFGLTTFKSGSVIPLSFQVKDVKGKNISTAKATLSYAKVTNGVDGTIKNAVSANPTIKSNSFSYVPILNQYIFNFSTKGLTTGTYKLFITLDDGQTYEVKIGLR